MDDILQLVLKIGKAQRLSYATLFQQFLGIDPHHASLVALSECAAANNISVAQDISDRDTWLDLLMTHCIEPKLGKDVPVFIYDFPASQAALARIQAGEPALASRFEVYYRGIELANGFHELQNAAEQRKRFEKNIADRKHLGLNPLPIDEFLLAALHNGLPDCAGVALGVDRLIMLATESNTIAEVLSFNFERA
jgi:lysyl-tRNA synthetase class 2